MSLQKYFIYGIIKKLMGKKRKKTIIYSKNRVNLCHDTDGMFFCTENALNDQMTIDDYIHDMDNAVDMANKLGEANQEVAKQKSKKKKITNAIFFVFNICVVVAILLYQVFNSHVQPFDEIISSGMFRAGFVLVIIVCFIFVMFLDTFRVTFLLWRSTKRFRPTLCYKMNSIGRYYDCITPMSTGGQPFQVFYLSKHGVDPGTAISIPLARYVVFQIAWLITCVFATIYSSQHNIGSGLVSAASYIGFALNALMLVGVWVLSVSKKIGRVIVAKLIKLLYKMHIIKSYEKIYDKVMDTVAGFQQTMTRYTKDLKSFILLIFTNLLQFVINFSIPYFIFIMLGGAPSFATFVQIWVFSVLIEVASGFIPLPGGTGMSEVAFTLTFASIYPNGTVFWGLLLWRFMNYYIYLIQGLLVLVYDYVIGNKKYEWQKKKWELEAESTKFKQVQLKKYNKTIKSGKIKL